MKRRTKQAYHYIWPGILGKALRFARRYLYVKIRQETSNGLIGVCEPGSTLLSGGNKGSVSRRLPNAQPSGDALYRQYRAESFLFSRQHDCGAHIPLSIW